ncbi:hypothetical protein ACJIZ3_013219 [Penstemon smallii]|uniref:Maturase K n=1 Tax=Penstemon smallii TaxID=265156 RepID=A0ABD3UQB3_9LAMI
MISIYDKFLQIAHALSYDDKNSNCLDKSL